MKTRNFVLCALGLAAAITFGGAQTASAQAKSQKRIPVRKDAPPAEVVAPKPDTVRIVRVDTFTIRSRPDTVTIRMRPDTVIQMQVLPLQKLPGVYFGIGAGVATPMNSWRNPSKDGLDLQGQVGWFPKDGMIGLRADVNYAMINHRDTGCAACPDTKVIGGSADVVFRMPLDRTSKLNPVLYVLGGGGLDKISDFLPYRNTENLIVTAGENTYLTYPGLALTAATAGTKSMFFHYELGGGLDVNAGPAHLFAESKYSTLNTINGNSHYWPTIAGFKFY
jgi:hypothetical protein